MNFPDDPRPRGIRNNNPGNIRRSKSKWQGQSAEGADPDFVTFASPAAGLRALMKTLLTYHRKYGLDTVQSIINRWAPPHENATDHYAQAVARRLKTGLFLALDLGDARTLAELAAAIVNHENGQARPPLPPDWYPSALYRETALATLKETLAT